MSLMIQCEGGMSMSILIKGMEMPQNCQSCNFYNGLGCKATGRMFAMFYNVATRRNDCPLTEVPEPHEDLIDRDKLRAKEFIHDGDAYAVVMSRDIRNAPTVIPASNEGWVMDDSWKTCDNCARWICHCEDKKLWKPIPCPRCHGPLSTTREHNGKKYRHCYACHSEFFVDEQPDI